jgi:inhibitor of KinA
MNSTVSIEPFGDRAVLLRAGPENTEGVRRRVRAVRDRLAQRPPPGVLDIVPAFTSVTVHYDPLITRYSELAAAIEPLLSRLEQQVGAAADLITIPVHYDGPDLAHVAAQSGVSVEEVIRLHSAGWYEVQMIGFAPGFAYLGGLAERIACPRRGTPRTNVPAGSVGIAGNLTGVYPIDSPGGWQLIGRTRTKLFDAQRVPATLLRVGAAVRFTVSAP